MRVSRKRRRKPGGQLPAARKNSDVQRTPFSAADGFINRIAFMGEASPLMNANTYERNSITGRTELLSVLYRENWIAKKIIDAPAEDMTRAWYSVASEIEQDKLDMIAKLEAKHNIKQEITNAIRWARLYGGSACVMVIKGQEDMLDEPLDFDMLMPGCFRGLIVVDCATGLYPSIELEQDMDDTEFGYPMFYYVYLDALKSKSVKVHHSRLLTFRGRMLPIEEEISENYWGASELEHVYEELQKRNATSANIAQLVYQANITTMKMADYGEVLGMGTERQREAIFNTVAYQNRLRDSFGMFLMGKDDNFEQHQYSFGGLSEIYESFMLDMAGAAEIPATRLYGRAPQGMNATGESDMKNYYEMLAQLQERQLRPAIEKLLPVMAMSLWGTIPEDMEVVFEPLMTTTPTERAAINSQETATILSAFTSGLISQRTALLELQEMGKEIGEWTNITDEDIENAEAEVDSGEMSGDPMAAMMGEGQGEPQMEGQPEMQSGNDPLKEIPGQAQPFNANQEVPDEPNEKEAAIQKP